MSPCRREGCALPWCLIRPPSPPTQPRRVIQGKASLDKASGKGGRGGGQQKLTTGKTNNTRNRGKKSPEDTKSTGGGEALEYRCCQRDNLTPTRPPHSDPPAPTLACMNAQDGHTHAHTHTHTHTHSHTHTHTHTHAHTAHTQYTAHTAHTLTLTHTQTQHTQTHTHTQCMRQCRSESTRTFNNTSRSQRPGAGLTSQALKSGQQAAAGLLAPEP